MTDLHLFVIAANWEDMIGLINYYSPSDVHFIGWEKIGCVLERSNDSNNTVLRNFHISKSKSACGLIKFNFFYLKTI